MSFEYYFRNTGSHSEDRIYVIDETGIKSPVLSGLSKYYYKTTSYRRSLWEAESVWFRTSKCHRRACIANSNLYLIFTFLLTPIADVDKKWFFCCFSIDVVFWVTPTSYLQVVVFVFIYLFIIFIYLYRIYLYCE